MAKALATEKKRDREVRALVKQLEGDPDALSLVVQLAEMFASRSRHRRR